MHLAPGSTSALPQILDRAGPLPAVVATHGRPLAEGVIHVAPPDRHLLIDDRVQFLSHGPTESGHRPAINATFRSAAVAAGPAAGGGGLSRGLGGRARGARAVAAPGGGAVGEDPGGGQDPGVAER